MGRKIELLALSKFELLYVCIVESYLEPVSFLWGEKLYLGWGPPKKFRLQDEQLYLGSGPPRKFLNDELLALSKFELLNVCIVGINLEPLSFLWGEKLYLGSGAPNEFR
eukprot:TRINITY_DN6493_c0_g1_i1.p3 TRINITY_DN6493_c0_g1~~TRINITY_DN6493_c0_g1_i1.p3  ORF type:complete len:109 (-),score=12.14 TRINITY_DN6493_c0_g1_i1:118-444(-)